MTEYTILLCFDENDMTRVLMCLKDRSKYAGKFNGLGGKVEAGETPYDGALRELKEEAGVEPLRRMELVLQEEDEDCKNPGQPSRLYFYKAFVNAKEVQQQYGESEILAWIPVRTVFTRPNNFASEGGLQEALQKCIEQKENKPSAFGISLYASM